MLDPIETITEIFHYKYHCKPYIYIPLKRLAQNTLQFLHFLWALQKKEGGGGGITTKGNECIPFRARASSTTATAANKRREEQTADQSSWLTTLIWQRSPAHGL